LANRLATAFGTLAKKSDIVLVDAELGADDTLPIPAMMQGEIVVQVSTSATSIKHAYAIIKRLNAKMGRRPFSLLVTGASDKEAKVVYDNMADAARRYLAVELHSMGSVPADEHLKKAAYLGRSVVEAFPLAVASVAFRRLAGRCSLSEMPAAGMRGLPSAGTSVGR
jgi:flagellar biosynthesis protein FlhG